MRYRAAINFEGTIEGERGGPAQMQRLEGAGTAPQSNDNWTLRARIGWPREPEGPPAGAELEIGGPEGGRLHGRLRDGTVTTITDETGRGGAGRIDLRFEVDGSEGPLRGASGSVYLFGTVEPQGFMLSANLDLDVPEGVWQPPLARPLSALDAAAGAAPTSAQGREQQGAERPPRAPVARPTPRE